MDDIKLEDGEYYWVSYCADDVECMPEVLQYCKMFDAFGTSIGDAKSYKVIEKVERPRCEG